MPALNCASNLSFDKHACTKNDSNRRATQTPQVTVLKVHAEQSNPLKAGTTDAGGGHARGTPGIWAARVPSCKMIPSSCHFCFLLEVARLWQSD